MLIASFENMDQEEFENLVYFQAGDELIALNGTPIQDLIETIIDEELGGDRTPTGYSLAERSVFLKKGKYGMTIPTGSFEITVRHKNNTRFNKYFFKWIHTTELIQDPAGTATREKIAKGKIPTLNESLSKLLAKDYSVGFAKDLIHHEKSQKLKKISSKMSFSDSSDDDMDDDYDFREKGFLPELGHVVWQTDPDDDSDIYAYLYLNPKGQKIGYIYIPTFMKDDEDLVEKFAAIIRRFEKESAALIIDITDNPGGSLLYTYTLLSMLTNRPLKTLPERRVLIQEDVYNCIIVNSLLKFIDELKGAFSGFPVNDNTLQQLIDFNEQMIHSWNSGKKMTDPLHVFGIAEIMPHPKAQYTKPLIVLTNELDFSCADLFPAILQDNKRAVIFGTKTAGAGGSVRSHPHMSQFGVNAITITESIGFRLDGTPIENRGVTPDIRYEISEKDLKENYVEYKRALNETVLNLVNP